jgi:outer membrane immunogenic protein
MRVLVVGAAMLAATGANASDLGAALSKTPAALWNGFYAGVNVGAGFAGSSGLDTPANQWGSITLAGASSGESSNTGAVGGFQAGVSRSVGNFVFGIEADISLASAGATNTDTALFSNQSASPSYSFNSWQAINTTYKTSLDWYATIRARLGYAVMPNVVVFRNWWPGVRRHHPGYDARLCDGLNQHKLLSGWVLKFQHQRRLHL